jgi:hypothetical protein
MKIVTDYTVGVTWKPGELISNFVPNGYSFPEYSALMERTLDTRMIPVQTSNQYRIRVTTRPKRALSILLRNGSGISYKGDIYVLSLEQLEALRENGVAFEIL